MSGPDTWFPVLDPPPGGLRSLQVRLDARRRPAWPWLVLLAAGAVALALSWPRPGAMAVLDAGLLARVAPPEEPVTLPPGAAATVAIERVPSEVVWYRVGGTVPVEATWSRE